MDFINQNGPILMNKNQNQVHFSKPRFFISIYNEKWSAADVLGQVERNLGRSADSTHHCRVRFLMEPPRWLRGVEAWPRS